MAKFVAPKYPDALTVKSWSKEEGIVAKILGKTDLMPALTACEKAYKAVDWSKLDLVEELRKLDDATDDDLKKLFVEGQKEISGSIKALDAASRKLEDAAKTAEAEFKKNGKIPSSSTAAAKKLGEAAKAFNYAVCVGTSSGSLQANLKDGEAFIVKSRADDTKALAEFLSALKEALAFAPKVKTSHDAREFQTKYLSKIGSNLQVALAITPGLKEFHKPYVMMRREKIDSHPNDQDDAESAATYMKDLQRILSDMKKKVEAVKR